MKKILLTIVVGALTMVSSYAQGTVNVQFVSGVTATTNGATQSGLATGAVGTYMYALLLNTSTTSATSGQAAPSSHDPLSSGWVFGGVYMTNTAAGGFINGQATATANANFAQNQWTYYEIVGWSTDGGLYTTWASVSAALSNGLTGAGLQAGSFYGVSAFGNAEPGGGSPSLPTPKLFGTSTSTQVPIIVGGITMNLVTPAPEPGTMALAALGGASLLLFRRRK